MPKQSGETLIEWLNAQPGEHLLDAGCGMGFLSVRLAAAGAVVTGIDLHPHLLEQARQLLPQGDFVSADLLAYDPGREFDAVFAHATLSWIRPPEEAARRLLRLLKPGGRLAAFLGGAAETAAQLEAYYLPEPKDYIRLLERAGFEVVKWEAGDGGFRILARRPLA
jgi:trans-aconitate methyltransferase